MANQTGREGISRRAILWLISVGLAFLLGFVPQFMKARSARKELAAVSQQLAAARYQGELAALRDELSMAHVEVVQKNYGLAAQRSTAFFDRLQALSIRETDSARKQAFEEALAARDNITAGLAGGDPAVAAEMQRLLRLIFGATAP